MTAPIFMNVNTSEPTPKIILSWGMGEDSTSVLLRWLEDPTSRDFDLEDLAIVTGATFPTIERFFVVAPALAPRKENAHFDRRWAELVAPATPAAA